MAYSFPPNPTLNQTYSSNGKTWKWNGVQWSATVVPTTTSSPVYVSVSPPPNPVSGSLWYDSTNSNLNMYYVDLNGGQWIAVVPYPQDDITQQGGVFEGPIYAQYEIPNNEAAFVTKKWVEDNLVTYLIQNGYMRQGDGVTIDPVTSEIVGIDSGLIV
jgi:hypothetical protein